MRDLLAALILLAAAPGGVAVAQEAPQLRLKPGMGGVIDIGATDCALFTEMHYNGPTGMRHNVLTWVQGYVFAKTGSNVETLLGTMPDDNGWDFDTLTDVFVEYCTENPDAQVSAAAIELWNVLAAGQPAPGR